MFENESQVDIILFECQSIGYISAISFWDLTSALCR